MHARFHCARETSTGNTHLQCPLENPANLHLKSDGIS